MNLATLKAELDDDPLGVGYAAMLREQDEATLVPDDEEIAESLNAKTRNGYKPLGSLALLAWGAANGRLAKINDAATKSGDYTAIGTAPRSVAMAADRMLARADTELDLANPHHAALVQALVLAKVLTTEDKVELMAMASTRISRGEELGLGHVTPSDVANARRAE